MTKKINVRGARPIGDQVIEEVNIYINGFFPDRNKEELDRMGHGFKKDAHKIFDGLRSLPGGTFDQLLILMLQKTASSFVVPHSFHDEKPKSSMLALLEKAFPMIQAENVRRYTSKSSAVFPDDPYWTEAHDLANEIKAEIDKAYGREGKSDE